MSALDNFRTWFQAFEACVADDGWDRLLPLLAEHCEYRVVGVPFACTLRGRDALVAGFARSIANFDRRFEDRLHIAARTRVLDASTVRYEACTVYRTHFLPPLACAATEDLHFARGRLELIVDYYDADVVQNQDALAWLERHAATLGLDPTYE